MDFCLTFPCNLLIACNHRLGTVFFKRIEPEKGLISDQSVIEACKPPGMAASRRSATSTRSLQISALAKTGEPIGFRAYPPLPHRPCHGVSGTGVSGGLSSAQARMFSATHSAIA